MMRRFLALGLVLVLGACAIVPREPAFHPVTFADLPHWQDDHTAEALPVLAKSCATLNHDDRWSEVCAKLQEVPPHDDDAARRYFETYFIPYAPDRDGLFTGYYEPELDGSLTREGRFQTPLWTKPRDMVAVDLGAFKPEWKGQSLTGKVKNAHVVPYDTRADVAGGSLQNRAEPLVWVDDPVAAFVLEIQGSGLVRLRDGSVMRVGYAAQNGRPYVAIGRAMLDEGLLESPVTMPRIRAWLAAHPDKAQEVMNHNPSVVFFKKLDGTGSVGAQGVTLTPLRSMAVDRAAIPFGAPLWLVTEDADQQPLRRLMIAQDTGGAIRGALRGDVFWGAGPHAEDQAGRMQSRGIYYVLLPRGPSP